MRRQKNWKDADICKFFPLCLQGPAFDAYGTIDRNSRGKWDALLPAFKDKFESKDTAKLFGREFRDRRQFPGESVEAYAYSLRKIARRAYPIFSDIQLDLILIDQFLVGLSEDLQSSLWDKEFQSFDEAVEKAKSLAYRKKLMITPNCPKVVASIDTKFNFINEREHLDNIGDISVLTVDVMDIWPAHVTNTI